MTVIDLIFRILAYFMMVLAMLPLLLVYALRGD